MCFKKRGEIMLSSVNCGARLPRMTPRTRVVSLLTLICLTAFGQTQNLSITNYQLKNSQVVQGVLSLTYTADIVNTGTALQSVSAVVTSPNSSILIVPGQNTLQFGPVPANSQVTSTNTI